jgi:nucleoside-diphosphate-sugar epimerase
MSRRLVVIGGNGFIGQETVRQAIDDGWEVLNLDPSAPRQHTDRSTHTRARHLAVSITDRAALDAAMSEFRPDAAVNLAAFGEGTRGLASGAARHPAQAVDINIGGMVNLITTIGDAGCAHLIWTSSSTVYGPAVSATPGGVREDAVLRPDIVYGATKAGAEHVARVLGAERKVRSVAVRLPLIYGGGRWYGGSQDQLVRFVDDLVADRPAHLDGWTDPADWMYVSDAAAFLLALVNEHSAVASAYNVSGHRCSLYEMGHALIDAAGAADRATVAPISAGAPGLPLMDTGLIETDLAYRPTVVTADHGARLYVESATENRRAEEMT